MLPIEFLYQENVDPALGLATDRHFLNAFHKATRSRVAVLRAYTMPGDAIAAGRYHGIDSPAEGPPVWRRLSGGRAVPFGEGFLGFSLLLPHRSALVSEEPFQLSPYQVPNRYARGVLTALRSLGADAFYPGRDFITVNRKVIGMVTFETDDRGALVFEDFLALTRDFSLLEDLRQRADPGGHLAGERLDPDAMTSLAAECRKRVSAREMADALLHGFAKQFGLETQSRELSLLERRAVEAIAAREFRNGWVRSRSVGPELDRHAVSPVPLGVFEVRLALEQQRFLREVRLLGDFIANSAGIETLEHDLRLCPADWQAIAVVADQIFNRPENYILGVGKLRTIPDTILKALG